MGAALPRGADSGIGYSDGDLGVNPAAAGLTVSKVDHQRSDVALKPFVMLLLHVVVGTADFQPRAGGAV